MNRRDQWDVLHGLLAIRAQMNMLATTEPGNTNSTIIGATHLVERECERLIEMVDTVDKPADDTDDEPTRRAAESATATGETPSVEDEPDNEQEQETRTILAGNMNDVIYGIRGIASTLDEEGIFIDLEERAGNLVMALNLLTATLSGSLVGIETVEKQPGGAA